ncbi:amidase [Xylariaceae sp. FL1272]|nr:amidase [Xylariaceae sp. FL1272]
MTLHPASTVLASPSDCKGNQHTGEDPAQGGSQFLTGDDISIISKDSIQIVEAIKCGHLTAVQVTNAFCKTAAIAHQIVSAPQPEKTRQPTSRLAVPSPSTLLLVWRVQGEEQSSRPRICARSLPTPGPMRYRSRTIAFTKFSSIKLLREQNALILRSPALAALDRSMALPISMKDQLHVKGVDTTMGYLTTELLSLGAVLYYKTRLPQTLLFGETKNNIIGETLNPNNTNLSCGGSSGGEGALQALRGSSLGLGTDIGGSVRTPAGFKGIFSLKPTPERMSYRNVASNNPGENTYRSTIGFLSTSLGGLELLFKSDLSTKPWLRDPAVVPIPFRDDVVAEFESRAGANGEAVQDNKPLKLGLLWTDKTAQPHPPITRGLNLISTAMKEAGHKVVDWNPPDQATAKRIHGTVANTRLEAFFPQGGWNPRRPISAKAVRRALIPDLRGSFTLREPMNLLKYQDLTLQGLDYEAEYSDYWNSTADEDGQKVDAVIMPVAPHAAVVPGKFYHTAYTEILNLMNYSVVVIPVTKADRDIDKVDDSYKPSNDVDRRNWSAYDPDTYHGAPVGLQLVEQKFEEEEMLAIAKIVLAAMGAAKARAG